jgi:hypothetical protein
MRSARAEKNRLGSTVRCLFVIGLLFSLSTFQAAWASIACMCQIPSQTDVCECAHACDPASGTHGKASHQSGHDEAETGFSVKGIESPYSNSMACCQPRQQSERPLVTFTNQLPADFESSEAVVAVVVPVTVYVTRTHDPPRSRPLYIRHSCLLI